MSEFTDDDWDALAAEYVLGTLEPDAAEAVSRRARADTALAAAIAGWQARLAPLATLADPAPPLPGLWEGIAGELGLAVARAPLRASAPAPSSATRLGRRGLLSRVWRDADVWRLAALLALLVGLAGVTYGLRQGALPRAVATLAAPGEAAPSARAEIAADGTLMLRPDHPVPLGAGGSLAVWALPLGSTAPVLLGPMPPQGGRMRAPALPDGSQVMVTLEPAAGPVPGGGPGRTLFAGTVTTVRPHGG